MLKASYQFNAQNLHELRFIIIIIIIYITSGFSSQDMSYFCESSSLSVRNFLYNDKCDYRFLLRAL